MTCLPAGESGDHSESEGASGEGRGRGTVRDLACPPPVVHVSCHNLHFLSLDEKRERSDTCRTIHRWYTQKYRKEIDVKLSCHVSCSGGTILQRRQVSDEGGGVGGCGSPAVGPHL